MSFEIAGLGTALPPYSITQPDAAEIAKGYFTTSKDQARLVPVLFRRTGVKSRASVVLRTANGPLSGRQSFFAPATGPDDRGRTTADRMELYEVSASPLAIEATRQALENAGRAPAEVTHLITVSCSGFAAPGVDIALIKALSMKPSIARTHIGFMGCHGAVNAMRVAGAITAADAEACVLVVAVELCSLHFQYGWDPEKIVANALFADGAAALVATPVQSKRSPWTTASFGSRLLEDSEDAMTWRIGDHGFEMTLSPRVPDLIEANLGAWISEWLDSFGLKIADILTWAIHPGGPRILTSAAASLGMDDSKLSVSYEVLEQYGNMSSPTLLFILERLREQNASLPCMALGFGPGLVIEAVLFR